MRILKVHNRYRQRGGEDVSFEAEVTLLRANGHVVRPFIVTNDDIPAQPSLAAQLKLAGNTIWSAGARAQLVREVNEFQPDLAHFDNTFPLISPSAYSACQQRGVPVVQSLRNYRLICPNHALYRDGRPCEDCVGKLIPIPGVVHSCYRNSRAETAVVAAMLTAHRFRRTWNREVDRYIALTEFAREKFIQGGIPAERIMVKPNFVDLVSRPTPSARSGMLYVGRLAPEKGIPTLLKAWSSHLSIDLSIIGDGPLRSTVDAAVKTIPEISYIGRQSESDAYKMMAKSIAVVVPSEWYEPFGRVVIEAFACGTPVIAARSGGLAELVEHGKTGLLFEPANADDLAAQVRWATEHPNELRQMGQRARHEYEVKYTPERNYPLLMNIYQQAVEGSARRRA